MQVFNRVLCGMIGGVAGVLSMQAYWKTAKLIMGEDPRQLTRSGEPDALDEMSVGGQPREEGESSSAAAGRIVYEAVTDHQVHTEDMKTRLSEGVHWGFGLGLAGLYGALRGPAPGSDVAGGAAFGTAVWAFADELAVPLLGLSKGATAYPLEQHVHRLFAHLVYGMATATLTQVLFSGLPVGEE